MKTNAEFEAAEAGSLVLIDEVRRLTAAHDALAKELEAMTARAEAAEADWQAAEQQLSQSRWRKVSEGLPDDGTIVLTYSDGIWDVTYRDNDYWTGCTPVTHWMPLPAAPGLIALAEQLKE